MQLLQLTCARLVCVNMSVLVSGLLLVLSRLALSSTHAFVDVLAALTVTLPGGAAWGCMGFIYEGLVCITLLAL